jgi:hypothetical protein
MQNSGLEKRPVQTYTPRSMNGTPLILLRWLAFWLVTAAPLGALEVRETIIGFDGRVVPGRFNPISVLIENQRPSNFEGHLVLAAAEAGGGTRGAEYLQSIFLAPHTSRWVQFHIFVGNYFSPLTLKWGRGPQDSYEFLDQVKIGPPACVWLRDTANPFASAGALKSFPEELFPTTVVATEGLDAVVLDHGPRWEPARREAFLDWLRRGGTLHLLPGADGRFPIFAEGLEVLNADATMTRIGAGQVRRHQIAAREVNEKYLATLGYPPRELKQTQNPVIYDLEATLFQRLSSLTRPTVSWTAIHLLALAYIGVIGPLHYRFRRRFDYRVSILAFLGVVAMFGTAFALVGRRGYGESQTVNSLTIAHALGGGRCDATQWISAFATKGDLYTLTHESPSNLYGPGGALDSGGSRALNGRDGRIELDIPLYSARTFVHRGVMMGADPAVTVERWPGADDRLDHLRLRTGPSFPADMAEAWIVGHGQQRGLVMKEGVLELSGNTVALSDYFSREKLSPLAFNHQFARQQNPDAHRMLMPLLAARALGAQEVFQQAVIEAPRPADRLQLCIVAPAPASFHLRGPGFSRERGWVLYVQDVFKP